MFCRRHFKSCCFQNCACHHRQGQTEKYIVVLWYSRETIENIFKQSIKISLFQEVMCDLRGLLTLTWSMLSLAPPC